MLSEALHIAEERREATSKGERERYIQLSAEFQRIARKDKKAFLNNQWKEIEGKMTNKMKTTWGGHSGVTETGGLQKKGKEIGA